MEYWDLSAIDLGLFGAGILIGLSESLATEGIDNKCIADSANILVSGFHMKGYMDDFIEGNKTDTSALTYSMVYFVSGWEATQTWNCDHIDKDIIEWFHNATILFEEHKPGPIMIEVEVESSRPFV